MNWYRDQRWRNHQRGHHIGHEEKNWTQRGESGFRENRYLGRTGIVSDRINSQYIGLGNKFYVDGKGERECKRRFQDFELK